MTKQSIPNEVSVVAIPEDQTQNWGEIAITTSKSLVEELVGIPTDSFSPYAVYNEHFDSIEAHFKNDEYYAQPLNENMDLLLSHSKNEIVGARIYNLKKIIPYQY